MKKYNTSLRMLLENNDDMLNEGYSKLKRISFVGARAAKCELKFPDEYRQLLQQYLTGLQNASYGNLAGIEYTKKKIEKDKAQQQDLKDKGEQPGAVGGALGNVMRYTETFFGAYATQMLTRENFQTIEELFNMFIMDDVPYVYCQALNRLMKMLVPVIEVMLEKVSEEQKAQSQSVEFIYDISNLYQAYGKNVILPKIYSNAVEYTNKLASYNIDFFSKPDGRNKQYAILFFENFSKEFLKNDNFDVNKLKEDIQDFEEIISLGAFQKSDTGLTDTEYLFEEFIEAVGFDDSSMQHLSDTQQAVFSKFDDENPNKETLLQIKLKLKNEYIEYLIMIIEKIFYNSNFINNIPTDCKNELNQFLSFLNSKLEN